MSESKQPLTGDWYCPKCEYYIDSMCVTFEETHDMCGTDVEWHKVEGDPDGHHSKFYNEICDEEHEEHDLIREGFLIDKTDK